MGCVYLLGDWTRDNVYKIGVTRGDVEKRIKKLQTGNSGEIYLIAKYETKHPFQMEKMLHLRYNNTKILNEWFSLTPEEAIHFKKTCAEIQENIDALEDNYYFQKKYGKKRN